MNDLASRQEAFLHSILDENAPLPKGWGNSQATGMAVYRGNYRSAVMTALSDTYERTALYVGGQAFARVSINHAIKHPPTGWTIDDVGRGFDETCAEFFPNNPEVAELAWLEWSMLQLATAPDTNPMPPQTFAEISSTFGEEEWGDLRLAMQPRSTARLVDGNLAGLWRALDEGTEDRPSPRLEEPQTCLVWREGERPTFIIAEHDHAVAFAAMQDGATYGEMIAALLGDDPEPSPEAIQNAAMRAGGILGKWLQEGMIVGVNP